LKLYHNAVKRYLIAAVTARARRCTSLLDLCCGRGGDIDKWLDAGIAEAHGVDISEEEISLARRRFEMKRGRHRDLNPRYTFDVVETLGTDRVEWPQRYDVVTCMFAAHFFPQSERTLDTFLGNVASALNDGGYFFGAIASGLGVLALLDRRDAYESPLLRVRRTWAGDHTSYNTFGSGYTFALGDTITNADVSSGEVVDDGAEEYLVFFGAFAGLAAKHGLFPDMSFPWDPEIGAHSAGGGGLSGGLDPAPAGGKHHAFRMFRPRYSDAIPHAAELTKASKLYAAFVFQKRASVSAAVKNTHPATPTADAVERPAKRSRE